MSVGGQAKVHTDGLPLVGLRVIDMADGPLAVIGRTLAEWGATVLRIEPRAGAQDRYGTPAVAGVGIDFAIANAGKACLALDLETTADRLAFEDLAAEADILIEGPNSRADDLAEIRRRNPVLVILTLSGFGTGNSFSGWQFTDPVLHAMSGELSRSGLPGRPPLIPPGELALHCAAMHAMLVALVARFDSVHSGRGDRIDLSLLDAAIAALDPGYGSGGSAAQGVPASKLPRGRPNVHFQYPIFKCLDGYVRICVLAPRQWQAMFDWLGRPEEFADPSFNKVRTRYKSQTLIPAIAALFSTQHSAKLVSEAQRRGVPLASVLPLKEAIQSDQIRARGAMTELTVAPGVALTVPNGIVEFDGFRAGLAGPVAGPGKHQQFVENGWPMRTSHDVTERRSTDRPLEGLRVLDLGVIVVGAETGRLLADLGADVIKIENKSFPDGSRQTRGEPISVSFAVGHRNKRSLGLNLRSDEGKALFLDLAAKADVIVSNFKPGTLESLGFASETLLARNPALILVDSSAYGPTGPASRRMGFGPLVRAEAGLSYQWRYPDDPESFSDALTVYPDHVCGRIGAAGVIALLLRRMRTGRGGTLSVAQVETIHAHIAGDIARLSAERQGLATSSETRHDAPWGVFPCAGDDAWCVVSVRSDADWQALCRVMHRPDLAMSSDLATREARSARRSDIDAAVSNWLRDRSPEAAAAALQAEGVPAAPMLRVAELPHHAYFKERQFLRLVGHPHIIKPFFAENFVARTERLESPPQISAPMQSEHSAEIAREVLGLDAVEIDRLIAEGVFEIADTLSVGAA